MQLHVIVIGAQTQRADTKKPYTVYRTAVNYRGECAQRLIRYRQFRWFHKHLEARDRSALRDAAFPEKKWTRGVSLQHEVVEARQVLLNEYMEKVAACELTPGSFDRLLRLLKVGDYNAEAGVTPPLKTPAASTSCEHSGEHSGGHSGGSEESEHTHEDSGIVPALQEDLRGDGKEIAVGPSIAFRSMTSSADTVLTDDERDERATIGAEDPSASSVDRPARGDSTQKSSRPQLAAKPQRSPSPTTQQPNKVQFDQNGRETPVAADADEEMADDGSPEQKYRRQIEQKMSNIQDMISSFSSLDDGPKGLRESSAEPIRT